MSDIEPPFICNECGHPITAHQAAVTRTAGPCSVCGCRTTEPPFSDRVHDLMRRHWRVLNRLEPHLGCVRCGRILHPDGRCETCDDE